MKKSQIFPGRESRVESRELVCCVLLACDLGSLMGGRF